MVVDVRSSFLAMVKDSKKYASTGGWEFAQFNDGKPTDEAVHHTRFSCHDSLM